MENKTKLILKGSLLAGSIISLGALQANAEELVRAENLGSGGEIRATLLASERVLDNAIELKCGEKETKAKEETKKSESKSESKAEEAKCGEGKCGESSKTEESKKAEKSESKAEEHKCGEGKCGEGKCGM